MKGARLCAVLISGALLVPPSFAADGVFLETEVARRLVETVYAGEECFGQLELCESQLQNAEEQNRILAEGITKGEELNSALRAETESLGGHLRDVAGDLSKCEQSKPSRVKWYAGGFVTGALAIVLAGMAMK